MAKPTNSWWTNNAAYRTEPASGRKNTGYAYKDKPSYQVWNWIIYNLYAWVNWISDYIGDFYTVGTDGDYADLNAAIAAGKTKLVLKSNLLITVSQVVSLADVKLRTNGFKIYTGAGAIADSLVEITGDYFENLDQMKIESMNTQATQPQLWK